MEELDERSVRICAESSYRTGSSSSFMVAQDIEDEVKGKTELGILCEKKIIFAGKAVLKNGCLVPCKMNI